MPSLEGTYQRGARRRRAAGGAASAALALVGLTAAAGIAFVAISRSGAVSRPRSLLAALQTDAATAPVQLWLDCRAGRQPLGKFAFDTRGYGQAPDIKKMADGLVDQLKEKLEKIGIEGSSALPFEAVLVDENVEAEVLEIVKDSGFAVYTTRKTVSSARLPDKAVFICTAGTNATIGAMDFPPVRISMIQKPQPMEVWEIIQCEEDLEVKKEKEEYEKRYLEGIKSNDPSKYIPPSAERTKWLFGLESDMGSISVARGEAIAKCICPDPLLWARELMLRSRAIGKTIVYKSPSIGKREADAEV